MADVGAQPTTMLAKLGWHLLQTISGAAAISVFFFIWSDYVDKQPNLNGNWYFTSTIEDTSYSRFKGLKVTYQVNLLQDKLHLTGFGEKISDDDNGAIKNYVGKDRAQIDIAASINHRYLSKDTLEVAYTEAGTLRKSSTFMHLVRYSDDAMSGTFTSTIANTKGSVEWRRTR